VFRVRGEKSVDEHAVHFQLRYRKSPQLAQAGISGPKVAERQVETGFLQILEKIRKFLLLINIISDHYSLNKLPWCNKEKLLKLCHATKCCRSRAAIRNS
jgi:hypothetical protein